MMPLPLMGELPYGATDAHRTDLDRLEVHLTLTDGSAQVLSMLEAVRLGYVVANVQSGPRWVGHQIPRNVQPWRPELHPFATEIRLVEKTPEESKPTPLSPEEFERLRAKRRVWDSQSGNFRKEP